MLSDVFVLVIFAHAQPFSELFSLFNFDQGDLVLGSKSLDDFNVVGFGTVLGENNVFGSKFVVFNFDGFADFVNSFS